MAYRLTPRRRMSILRAQRVSARKRKGTSKDFGWALTKLVKKGANVATFGTAGKLSEFLEENKAHNERRKRARQRRR